MAKTARQRKKAQEEAKEHQRKVRIASDLRSTILTFNNPLLKQIAEPVSQIDAPSCAFALKKVCFSTKDGVGLAAPQIGIMVRMIFVSPHRTGHRMTPLQTWTMCNPEVVARGGRKEIAEEGCLSYPGFFTQIERDTWITIRYRDVDWREQLRTFRDFTARVIQHELDHLLGICLVGDAWEKSNAQQKPTN